MDDSSSASRTDGTSFVPRALEDRLKESEERFRILIDQATDGIFIADASGRYQDVNPAGCQMLGYTLEELLRLSIVDVLDASEIPRLAGEIARLRGGKSAKSEWRFRRKDGSILYGEVHGRQLPDSRLLGFLRDIGDRKRAEQEVERSHTLLKGLVETSPVAMLVVATDEDGRPLLMNDKFTETFGYTIEDVPDVIAWWPIAYPDPVYRAKVQQAWQHAIESAAAAGRSAIEPVAALITCRDGSVRDVEIHMGHFGDRALVVFSDFTERKHTEELLRKSEERYRLIVENQTEFIVKWLPDGTRTFVNERYCRTFGVTEQDCLGTSFFPLVSPEYRDAIVALTATLTPEAPSFTEEHESIVPEGQRWQQWTSRGIFDAEGQLVEVLSTGRDITDRVRLEAQLQHAQKMQAIGQLAGGVAHDFNNLLTIINGHAEMLLDGKGPGSPDRLALAAIRDAGERAALLTRQLLLFSRKAVLEPRVLDCNAVVQRTSQMLRRLISEDVVISTVLDPAVRPIKADLSQIEQILLNLSLNAHDAMPRGGRLSLETKNVSYDAEYCRENPEYKAGRYVQLVIADTGVGMSPEVKAHVFEPFFTTKGPGKGTGLGLATVYGIVQESGGFVTFTSEVGSGSTFNVCLPALGEGDARLSGDTIDRTRLRGHETVLLVEDDAAVRQIAKLALEKYGYQVLEAADGAAALDLSGGYAGTIDILLSDIVMPGINGRMLADALRASRPRCEVLFMSGYNEDALVLRGVHAGAEAFIQKPFALEALVAKLRQTLDRRSGSESGATSV